MVFSIGLTYYLALVIIIFGAIHLERTKGYDMKIERPYYQVDQNGVYFQSDRLTMRFDKISDLDVLIAQLAMVRAEISMDDSN